MAGMRKYSWYRKTRQDTVVRMHKRVRPGLKLNLV